MCARTGRGNYQQRYLGLRQRSGTFHLWKILIQPGGEEQADGRREGREGLPLFGISYDLRIPPRDIEHDRVIGARDFAAHLDVSDAVVDAHQWFVPQETQTAGGDGHGLQRRPHPGTLGEAYAVDVRDLCLGLLERAKNQRHDPVAVVFGRVLWEEAFAGRRDVCVPDVGEDLGGRAGEVANKPDAEFVGRAFESKGNHCGDGER